ncbi:uncharacterized protein COLE_04597 [Cutaneotrichosporon oleaginosum]|nr:hypothetical protein COLE_04597 [Cutaneotrichosporon oleaginosum]
MNAKQEKLDNYGLTPVHPDHDEPAGLLARQLSREAYAETAEAARESHTDIGPPPDGGVAAWSAVGAASCVLLVVFGFSTSMGQLQAYYLENQLRGRSKADVAWLGSIQSMLIYTGSLYAGRLFDAYGPERLMWTGTVLLTGSFISMAFCTQYWQFLLAHMLFGIGGTTVYSPSTSISGHWFARRRGTAVSVVITGAGLGGIAYPLLMRELFIRLSFRNTLFVLAGFTFAAMIPACTIMHARLPRRKPPPWSIFKEPWKEAPYVCLVTGAAVWLTNVFTPYFNAPVLAATNRLSPEVTSYAVLILQSGSFVGRIIVGPLADRVGVWSVFGAMSFLSSLFILALWTGDVGPGAAIAGLILFGMTSGGWMTMVTAATSAISPVTQIGMRIGMLWTFAAIPNLVGPVISGALIGAAGGKFIYAGLFTGLMMFVGSGIMVAPHLIKWWRERGTPKDGESTASTNP